MSRRSRFWLLPAVLLLVMLSLWLAWNYPHRVDMATYVPANSLVYLEANSMPAILEALVRGSEWKKLAPSYGMPAGVNRVGWLAGISAWTGLGSAEQVILARSQFALAILDFKTSSKPGSIEVKPELALVIETHTGEHRVSGAARKIVGDFARRLYGNPIFSEEKREGVTYFKWTAPESGHFVVAAVTGTVAVVGNDDAAVQSCLAVRRHEQPSLAVAGASGRMRSLLQGHLNGDGALASGYVSQQGATRLMGVAALSYAPGVFSNPSTQSIAAAMLPRLGGKLLGDVYWQARAFRGLVEDSYFISLQDNAANRLKEDFAYDQKSAPLPDSLLPANLYQLTCYRFRDPAQAWRGLGAALSSHLDALSAPIVINLLERSLSSYGVGSPAQFLQAIGPEVFTMNLSEENEKRIIIAPVRDNAKLLMLLRQSGIGQEKHIFRGIEILAGPSGGQSAAILKNYLVLGDLENVQKLIEASPESGRPSKNKALMEAQTLLQDSQGFVVSFTNETETSTDFVRLFAPHNSGSRADPIGDEVFYASSTTELLADGVHRQTLSGFGQFAAIASQVIPESGNATR